MTTRTDRPAPSVRLLAILAGFALALSACGPGEPPAPPVIRLVDAWPLGDLKGEPSGPPALPRRTEWRFAGGAPPDESGPRPEVPPWQPGHAVADVGIRDGRLSGRTTGEHAFIRVERAEGLDDPDLLHAIEVRLRASAGANLAVSFDSAEELDIDRVVQSSRDFDWRTSSPLVPGEDLRTYTLTPANPVRSSQIRHLLLRPSDVGGAGFEIESVRLVFRKEHLATYPSGVGWHGLGGIYHETVVTRSPEEVSFDLHLPDRPWLDLSLGTIESGPVTFTVRVAGGSGPGPGEPLLERTLTRADRWEQAPVDLSAWSGQPVTLTLALTAGREGALGFWGSPVIRSSAPSLPGGGVAGRAAPPLQGVILVMADTLRRDHLGVYGHARDTSPNLTRMATEGALFTDCTLQATWTKVSTPSIMTSLYPTSHGVKDFSDRLPAAARTLAESFRDAGYATVSYSSILFTGQFTNLHQGFEELHEDSSLPDQDSSKTARDYVDRLLPWLDAHASVPFFAFLHVSDPHDPYRPYPPYDALWTDPAKAEEHESHQERVREVIGDPLMKRFGMPTRAELEEAGLDADAYVEHDKGWYDASIRAMDAEVGRIFEKLRALGLDDRTLVVFISDHGEEFLEHGRMFHGQSLYGELTNAPLIVWGPGRVAAGATLGASVQSIDVMPTILDLAGIEAPESAQGVSLAPLLGAGGPAGTAASAGLAAADGPEPFASRPAVSERAVTNPRLGGPPPRDIASVAITLEGWKLIHNGVRKEGTPEYELYETAADPLNLRDVAAEHPEIVARLGGELERWRSMAEAARLPTDAEAAGEIAPEELERLRSLGYVE